MTGDGEVVGYTPAVHIDQDDGSDVIDFVDEVAKQRAFRQTLDYARRRRGVPTALTAAGRLIHEHGDLARTRLRREWVSTWGFDWTRIDRLLEIAGMPIEVQLPLFSPDE